MAKDRQEHFLGFVQVLGEPSERLGERLIDRFVESCEIVQVGGCRVLLLPGPEPYHAGT